MASITWTLAGNGSWSTAADWSGFLLPGPLDDAVIAAGAPAPYTVTLDSKQTVHSLTIDDPNAIFDMASGLTTGLVDIVAGIFHGEYLVRLDGATVILDGGAAVLDRPTLNGVTWRGTMVLDGNNHGVQVTGGIVLTDQAGTGRGRVVFSGGANSFYTGDNETIANTDFVFTGAAWSSSLAATAGTLTLAQSTTVTVNGASTASLGNGGSLVNQGSIVVTSGTAYLFGSASNQGLISVGAGQLLYDFSTGFTNSGTIATNGGTILVHSNGFDGSAGSLVLTNGLLQFIQANASLAALGSVTGGNSDLDLNYLSFELNGGTLQLGTGSAFNLISFTVAKLHGGTVASAGGLQFGGNGGLDAVSWDGTLALLGGATAQLSNQTAFHGVNGTGNGQVLLQHSNTNLQSLDAQAVLANVDIAMGYAGSNGGNGAGVTGNAGTNRLTLAASTTIDGGGDGFSVNAIDQLGSLVNQGSIVSHVGTISLGSPSYPLHVTNTGTMAALGGRIDMRFATLDNLVAGTLSGGTWIAGAGSTIDLRSGAVISVDAADITLGGLGAVLGWDANGSVTHLETSLASIAAGGALRLLGGYFYVPGVAMAVNGKLEMRGASFVAPTGAATPSIGASGTLLGSGSVAGTAGAVLANAGLVEANGGRLSLGIAVGGAGLMRIDAGATLELKQAVAAPLTVAFTGGGEMLQLGNAPGFAATIGNFGHDDAIDLENVAFANVTSAVIAGSVLTVTTTNMAPLSFALSAPGISGALKVVNDGTGGAEILGATVAVPVLPASIDLGNVRIGTPVMQGITLTNAAAPGAESLDAQIASVAPGLTAGGQVVLLAPGQTDGTGLWAGMDTGTDGMKQGKVTVALQSTGSNYPLTNLPSQDVQVSGTVWAIAAPHLLLPAGGTVDLGAARVGDAAPTKYVPLMNGTPGAPYDPYLEDLLWQAAAPSAPSISMAVSSGTISAGYQAAPKAVLGTALAGNFGGTTMAVAFTSSGAIDAAPDLALPGATVKLAGRVYAYAVPVVGAPGTISAHVGQAGVTGTVALANAATGALTDALAVGFDAASGPFSLLATPGPIAAGQGGNVVYGVDTSTEGAKTGALTLWLDSTDAELPDAPVSYGGVALSAKIYAYALGGLSRNMVDFGAHRVGDAIQAQTVTLSNGPPDAFRETLGYSIGAAPSGLSVQNSGVSGTLVAGQTADIGFSISSQSAGYWSVAPLAIAEQSLALAGSGFSGVTANSSADISVSGRVYQTAQATIDTPVIDFGILHVGDVANTLKFASITNSAPVYAANLNMNDRLSGSFGDVISGYGIHPGIAGALPNGFTSPGYPGSPNGQLLGTHAGDTDTLPVQIDTSAAAIYASAGTIAFSSWDAELSDFVLPSQGVVLKGSVLNYAKAGAVLVNAGSLQLGMADASHYTLNLGTLMQGATPFSFGLEAANTAQGPADVLSGFIGVATQTTLGFGLQESPVLQFSGIGAQQASAVDTISVDLGSTGQISAEFVIISAGSNASGYVGPSSAITIDVTGSIDAAGQNLIVGPGSNAVGGAGADSFTVAGGVLNWRDSLDGGGGTDTLVLAGGGYFDLAAPQEMVNIETVRASEGQQALGTLQTVALRAGTTQTVNVASGGAGAGINITTNNNADTINLGNGAANLYLQGGAAQTINAGGADGLGTGSALIYVNAATLGTHINGAAHGATTLSLGGSGRMAIGANITNIATITLGANGAAVVDLSLGGLRGVQIRDNYSAADTIRLDNATQSVVGGLNTRVVVAAENAGALVIGAPPASAGVPASTLTITGGGVATLNAATSNMEVHLAQATRLTLSAQSGLVAIGSDGADTIVAMASGQVLTGGAGPDFLASSTRHGDTFRDTLGNFQGDTIAGFRSTDRIDVLGVLPDAMSLGYDAARGVLMLNGGGVSAALSLQGSYNAAPQYWTRTADGHGGTLVGYAGP